MFNKKIQALYVELLHSDPEKLKQLASGGGWRKRAIESGGEIPTSIFDLQGLIFCLLSGVVE